VSTPPRTTPGGQARERPLVGIGLIVVALIVIAIAVDRISFGGAAAVTTPQRPKTGIVVEIPPPAQPSGSSSTSSTTTSSTPTSTTTSTGTSVGTSSSSTTTLPAANSGTVAELVHYGYLIKAVVYNSSPPASTEVEYLVSSPGSVHHADSIAGVLGLARTAVVLYSGPAVPTGTAVVVILGKSTPD
jgi:hypothetical protein